MNPFTTVNPPVLGRPVGFSHGMLAPAGSRLLFVAGQTAADAEGRIADTSFAPQFEAALTHVLTVVATAGGRAEHVARMTIYVTDMDAYLESRPTLGEIWTRLMDRHYPAMALVGVTRLVNAEATVEIEATAVIPS
ncbi:MAG: RidA family protein [Vicinamibacterales bacterium]